MVNTVGSCENKHWHKKWIPIKRSLSLTLKQKALIIGSLLGDGTMRLGKGAQNVNFKIEHGLVQKCFRNIFGIRANYYKDRDKGYRIYFNQEETKKLIKIIYPYIIPSMMYKIGFATP